MRPSRQRAATPPPRRSSAGDDAVLVIIVAGTGVLAAVVAYAASAARAHPAADPLHPPTETPALRRFITRHPKLRRFLDERLDRRRAGGYVLTIGFLIVFAV